MNSYQWASILKTFQKTDAGGITLEAALEAYRNHPDVVAYCRDHGIEVMSDVELMQRLRESDASS